MKALRIFDNIYSFNVKTGNIVQGVKYFFDPCPEIKDKRIKGITISNTINLFYTHNFYLTLVDQNNKMLIQDMPLIDLKDSQDNNVFRLRMFDLKNIDLNRSYFYFQDPLASIVAVETLFKINFYY